MGKVPFSIIGYGRIGLRHAEQIHKLGRLVSVCDSNKNALDNAKQKYSHIQCYATIEELLEKDHDSVVINVCTPNGLHAQHTIQALRNGKHVVCEKPMAITVKDCQKMINEAKRNHRFLFIVKQNRFNPPIQELKKVIDAGRLGRILSGQINCFWNRNQAYYIESPWKGKLALDGGILFTQFSHFIDLLYWFLGDIADVRIMSHNFCHKDTIEFDDTLIALLCFQSDALITLNCTINSYQKNMEGSVTLFGERGSVKVGGQYLNTLEYQNIEDYRIQEITSHRPPNEYGFYQGSMSNHDKVIANVIEVIEKEGKIATSGEEGMKTVEIIEKIYTKIRGEE